MTGKKPRILVIKLGALGDFIQALGPMAAIRKHHSEACITLLTTRPFAGFGAACGYFDEVWIDERPRWTDFKGWLALRRRLREGRFRRVYDLQNNDRTALYLRLFPRRDRPEWVGAAWGASHRNASRERTAGQAFEGHTQTLMKAGIKDIVLDDLAWVKGDLKKFGLKEPFVLLVPGSAPQHPQKRWPAENYGVLARWLAANGYTPVVIGTEADREAVAVIRQTCPEIADLTGKTSLPEIALLAREAAAAIGNDTGPMHLIAPTGCPSCVLFSGASNPARHAPKGPCLVTIQKENLADLTVPDVLDQVQAILSISSPRDLLRSGSPGE